MTEDYKKNARSDPDKSGEIFNIPPGPQTLG